MLLVLGCKSVSCFTGCFCSGKVIVFEQTLRIVTDIEFHIRRPGGVCRISGFCAALGIVREDNDISGLVDYRRAGARVGADRCELRILASFALYEGILNGLVCALVHGLVHDPNRKLALVLAARGTRNVDNEGAVLQVFGRNGADLFLSLKLIADRDVRVHVIRIVDRHRHLFVAEHAAGQRVNNRSERRAILLVERHAVHFGSGRVIDHGDRVLACVSGAVDRGDLIGAALRALGQREGHFFGDRVTLAGGFGEAFLDSLPVRVGTGSLLDAYALETGISKLTCRVFNLNGDFIRFRIIDVARLCIRIRCKPDILNGRRVDVRLFVIVVAQDFLHGFFAELVARLINDCDAVAHGIIGEERTDHGGRAGEGQRVSDQRLVNLAGRNLLTGTISADDCDFVQRKPGAGLFKRDSIAHTALHFAGSFLDGRRRRINLFDVDQFLDVDRILLRCNLHIVIRATVFLLGRHIKHGMIVGNRDGRRAHSHFFGLSERRDRDLLGLRPRIGVFHFDLQNAEYGDLKLRILRLRERSGNRVARACDLLAVDQKRISFGLVLALIGVRQLHRQNAFAGRGFHCLAGNDRLAVQLRDHVAADHQLERDACLLRLSALIVSFVAGRNVRIGHVYVVGFVRARLGRRVG